MTRTMIGALVLSLATLLPGTEQHPLRVGDRFPALKGQFLTGRDAVRPQGSAGKIALMAIGFTYKSRFAVEAWAEWYRTTIDPKTDVTFFEVPMIGGLGTLGRWFIDRGMRRGTPVELHDHVITVYGGTGDWKQRLSFLQPMKTMPTWSSSTGRASCGGSITADSTPPDPTN